MRCLGRIAFDVAVLLVVAPGLPPYQ
ncbi:unnamed protein product, partial [Rotaria socialis]